MVRFQLAILELKSSLNGRIGINLNKTVIRLGVPFLPIYNLLPICWYNVIDFSLDRFELIVIVLFHHFIFQRFSRLCLSMQLSGVVALNDVRGCYFIFIFQTLEILLLHYKHVVYILRLSHFFFSLFYYFLLFRLDSHRFNHLFVELLFQTILNGYHH